MTSALLVAGMCSAAFAADGEFSLKGNVQTQATKTLADDDNNLSSFWIRANIGGLYKSDNFDAQVMLRIFAPQFGNKIKDGDGKTTSYDKILADLYWANYKWNFERTGLSPLTSVLTSIRTSRLAASGCATTATTPLNLAGRRVTPTSTP